ncbi:hypothetical protein GCM10010289_02240 [Streptomyces violascens]|uniref:Uncharacterized protein n=1 Tax=Streptomyces violascens TaxID=67381 RepID=A0ABQ3QF75_9ACTN|nr:hypothetical protein GCM10010289_02240 [Streptomyces violascens]GHI35889.1 hypothetical protein Sviol_02970 [Streptomyces violascens]
MQPRPHDKVKRITGCRKPINPTDAECRLLLQGAISAFHGTNATAVLFTDRGCEQRRTTMTRGDQRSFGDSLPHSVRFDWARLMGH